MKFVAKKEAPDIPLEIIEAQELGDLILFCGAGVSYPSGLPGFGELVDDVYKALNELPDPLEEEAIKSFLYDRALGQLENRLQGISSIKNNQVRENIISLLTIGDEADLSTHQALLELSKTNNGNYRLVTTNVDHCFLNAGLISKDNIDCAPKLPVAKPHKWESLVHLHGIIDPEFDIEGSNLVFTSGDFGSAYLTERWASKFVTELFNHFTVLFVGYSVNDPVLRYMTDAIAAEKRNGYKGFKQPYILTKGEDENDVNEWKAKGINPILYYGSHDNLHISLKAWAAHSRDGINSKIRIINEIGRIKPSYPYEQDEAVLQLVHTLKEKTAKSKSQVTGVPSREFARLSDPPGPIGWLPIFDENGLLNYTMQQDEVVMCTSSTVGLNYLYPDKRSLPLWYWLIENHLDKQEFVEWVINKGAILHPTIKSMIERQLITAELSKPLINFWQIILSDDIEDSNSMSIDFDALDAIENEINSFSFDKLLKILTPKIKILKVAEYHSETYLENQLPFNIITKVTLQISEHTFQKIKSLDGYPGKFIGLLLEVSILLKKAMDFEKLLGKASASYDNTFMQQQSISPAPQGQQRTCKDKGVLIEICRDLWEDLNNNHKDFSHIIIQIWKSYKFPVFRRLVLHAYTKIKALNQTEAIEYLLEDSGIWLWSMNTRREKFRLLSRIWNELSVRNTKKLLRAVLTGPPDSIFGDDISKKDKRISVERRKWHLLHKLTLCGRKLPKYAQIELGKITKKHPNWVIHSNQLDELAFTIHTHDEFDENISSEELFSLSSSELINKLNSTDNFDTSSIVEAYRNGVSDNFEKATDVLVIAKTKGIDVSSIWHATLMGLSDLKSKEFDWLRIAKLLYEESDDLYSKEQWVIAWWLEKSSMTLEVNSQQEEMYWELSLKLLDYCENKEISNSTDDVVSFAINDPVGILSRSVINRLALHKLERGDGFTDINISLFINKICGTSHEFFHLGTVVFFSRLLYFYTIDPDWSRDNLLTKLDWNKPTITSSLWQGFLWNFRVNADLALALKEDIINSVKYSERFKDKESNFHKLFAIICLEYPDLFTSQQKKQSVKLFGIKGLENIAVLLAERLKVDEEKLNSYWLNRIKPFIDLTWPRANDMTNQKISGQLSLMCIGLTTAFSDAVLFIKKFLTPIDDLSYFLHHLEDTDLPQTNSKDVFTLLSAVFSTEDEWPDNTLRKILNELILVEPLLKQEQKYKEMDEFLIANNL